MEYSVFDPTNLKQLKYNVFAVPKGKSILLNMPELNRLDAFVAALARPDLDKLIRYIMAMYDKNSPFVRMFQDVSKRKRECAHMAGYDIEKDRERLDPIFDFTDSQFSSMVIDFLKDQNSRVWTMIVSNEQTFYEYQKALLSEITNFGTDKDKLGATQIKSKLMEDSDTISERLEKYYQLLFGDDIMSNTNIDYRPEALARKNV